MRCYLLCAIEANPSIWESHTLVARRYIMRGLFADVRRNRSKASTTILVKAARMKGFNIP